MIDTIQKNLEEQSKEKDEFEKIIDNQYAVIAGLEQQLSAAKTLNDEKILLLEERGQTIKAKEKSIADVSEFIYVYNFVNLARLNFICSQQKLTKITNGIDFITWSLLSVLQ